MKTNIAQRAYLISIAIFGQCALAGTMVGGGGPPAKTALLLELMSKAPGSAGLFDSGNKELGLLVNGELPNELVVSPYSAAGSMVSTPDADFSLLTKKKNIDAFSIDGAIRSFQIEDGDKLNTLILKDRRDLIRTSIK